MAVKEANSKYKSFTFNGISAADYGVYVTDVNVFNSAERAVEYITIPGRNGSFALDHGRFENITVVYDCALMQDTDVDFVTAISDFRNALAAAKGYQRLEDEMNPAEYRMAVFSKGLDVPTLNQQTAKFKVEFDCKPQRFLKSGETAISVESGDTVTNPTPFDASPILAMKGHGTVVLNDDSITIANDPIGNLLLSSGANMYGYAELSKRNLALMNTGDVITVSSAGMSFEIIASTGVEITNVTASTPTGALGGSAIGYRVVDYTTWQVDYSCDSTQFSKGTYEKKIDSFTVAIEYISNGTTQTLNATVEFSLDYTELRNGQIAIMPFGIVDSPSTDAFKATHISSTITDVNGNSTRLMVTDEYYIDLEIGEAYTVIDGEMSGINNIVTMPAKLPTLVPGANTVTFDSDITDVTVTPRWWIV